VIISRRLRRDDESVMSFGVETVVTLSVTVLIIAANVLILLTVFTTDCYAGAHRRLQRTHSAHGIHY